MEKLDRFGHIRMTYLKEKKPWLFMELRDNGVLEQHLLSLQRRAELELEQLIFGGVEEQKAEEYVIRDYLHN